MTDLSLEDAYLAAWDEWHRTDAEAWDAITEHAEYPALMFGKDHS